MIPGIFASHSSFVADRAGDFNSRLLLTGYTGQAPMSALSAGMPKESTSDTSFSWTEDEAVLNHSLATAAANTVATTVTVADAGVWIPGSILLNHNTSEHMYVTAISGNTVTVLRGFQGTTPAAVAVNNRIMQVGVAFPEASKGSAAVMHLGESRTGYVQIFKGAWAVSGSADKVTYRTGPKLAESKRQAMDRLTEQLEEAAIFSRPSVSRLTTPDGVKEMRTTTGLNYAIRTYGGQVTIPASNGVTGRLSLRVLNEFMRKIFDRNIKGQPNERMCFTGSSFIAMIQEMIMDAKGYQFEAVNDKYGIAIHTLVTPNGTLKLMSHPMFVSNPSLQNELMVWHPGGLKRKMFRDLTIATRDMGQQTDSLDAKTGDLLMEMGYEIRGASTMGLLTGTTQAGGLTALPIV